MRPVNLIPPEDRRGDRAPLRAGALSYIVVGTFAAILVAVLAMVMTQNSITERENEIAELEVARDAAAQRAEALAPYAEFASLQAERELTITSLAQSRFDWERVLRELALVIPADATLTSLEASTAGSAEAVNAGVAPSLIMSGCAPTHESVATLVAALQDIDGLTRVGLTDSSKDGVGAEGTEGGAQTEGGASDACTAKGIVSFSLQAVFDEATAALTPAPAPIGPVTGVPADTNSQEEQVGQADKIANMVQGVAR